MLQVMVVMGVQPQHGGGGGDGGDGGERTLYSLFITLRFFDDAFLL
jgi:hypothetical protein